MDKIEKKLCLKGLNLLKEIIKKRGDTSSSNENLCTYSSNIIVGEKGYPNVSIAVVAPSYKSEKFSFSPKQWLQEGKSLMDIAAMRLSLINAFSKSVVEKHKKGILLQNMEEIALTMKPIYTDISFFEKPKIRPVIYPGLPPLGASAKLRYLNSSNAFLPKKVEKVVYDTDLNTVEGIISLWKKNIGGYYLSKLFSFGFLGKKSERKLVPTRWSITAIDDLIGKHIINKIREFEFINNFEVYASGLFGNEYIILFLPGPWYFELFEGYIPKAKNGNPNSIEWVSDMEGYFSRTKYAENTTGSYYASRLAVLEHLKGIKRQAKVLVIRLITPKYLFPLGVWVVREAVRKALSLKPIKFCSLNAALNYMKDYALKNFSVDPSLVFDKATSLKFSQLRLKGFAT